MSKFGIPLLIFTALTISIWAQNDSNNPVSDKKNAELTDEKSKTVKKVSYRIKRGKREIEIVPGFAPMQPIFFSGFKEYNTDGRKLAMFNVRFTRTIGTRKNITYQYFFEVTPLAVAFNNELKNPNYISAQQTPQEPPTIRRTTYGAGFQPVNFRLLFKPNSRVKPYFQTGAGMIFFNHKMPVPETTFYNFTGDFGGGLYIITDKETQKRAITLSYRYFHISNFNTTSFNPGYNAGVFSVGYSFFRR